MKAVNILSHRNYEYKEPPPAEGEELTQPDMTLSILEIYERSSRGMEVQGYTPVYYGNKHKELIGFENLSKIEQIDFSRKYKKYASDEVARLKQEADLKQAEALANVNNSPENN